jgi:hypothetical protein
MTCSNPPRVTGDSIAVSEAMIVASRVSDSRTHSGEPRVLNQ